MSSSDRINGSYEGLKEPSTLNQPRLSRAEESFDKKKAEVIAALNKIKEASENAVGEIMQHDLKIKKQKALEIAAKVKKRIPAAIDKNRDKIEAYAQYTDTPPSTVRYILDHKAELRAQLTQAYAERGVTETDIFELFDYFAVTSVYPNIVAPRVFKGATNAERRASFYSIASGRFQTFFNELALCFSCRADGDFVLGARPPIHYQTWGQLCEAFLQKTQLGDDIFSETATVDDVIEAFKEKALEMYRLHGGPEKLDNIYARRSRYVFEGMYGRPRHNTVIRIPEDLDFFLDDTVFSIFAVSQAEKLENEHSSLWNVSENGLTNTWKARFDFNNQRHAALIEMAEELSRTISNNMHIITDPEIKAAAEDLLRALKAFYGFNEYVPLVDKGGIDFLVGLPRENIIARKDTADNQYTHYPFPDFSEMPKLQEQIVILAMRSYIKMTQATRAHNQDKEDPEAGEEYETCVRYESAIVEVVHKYPGNYNFQRSKKEYEALPDKKDVSFFDRSTKTKEKRERELVEASVSKDALCFYERARFFTNIYNAALELCKSRNPAVQRNGFILREFAVMHIAEFREIAAGIETRLQLEERVPEFFSTHPKDVDFYRVEGLNTFEENEEFYKEAQREVDELLAGSGTLSSFDEILTRKDK